MFWLFICAATVLWLVYYIRWRREAMSILERYGIPGPRPSLIFGNLLDVYKNGQLEMHTRWHKQYGPIFGYYYGVHPVVLIADPELLKKILLKDFHQFADRPSIVSGEEGDGFEKSLLGLRGQRWKNVRSTLTPSFTSKKLKQLGPEVCGMVDEFMINVDEYHEKSKECDMYFLYQGFTLDTICRSAMGVNFEIQKNLETDKLLKQVRSMLSFGVNVVVILIESFPWFRKFAGAIALALARRFMNSGEHPVTILQNQCKEVIRLRRQNPEGRRLDILQLMIDARISEEPSHVDSLIAGQLAEEHEAKQEIEEKSRKQDKESSGCPFRKTGGLTDDELLDNAFTILIAGYETTSSSLAFITRMLLRFPEVQEKLRTELMQATNQGTVFDFETLQKCQFMEVVIQETLRMYPPIHFFIARTAAEEKKYDEITIPRGMFVFSSTKEVHYNEEIFPNPYDFRPERFLPENKTAAMTWAWHPFGAGPRNCIGMRFAQMEMKILLAKLLTKYRLTSDKEPLHNSKINTFVMPVLQQIQEPLLCRIERV